MTVEALIFAGGVGRRMGGSARPKQFLELGGRPIIDYTVAHFAEHPEHFDPRQYLTPAREAMKELYIHKIVKVLGSNNKL